MGRLSLGKKQGIGNREWGIESLRNVFYSPFPIPYPLLFIFFLIPGCSYPIISHQDVIQAVEQIEYEDKINRREAIALAQQYVIVNGMNRDLYTLKPHDVKKEITTIIDGEEYIFFDEPTDDFEGPVAGRWLIYFRHKKGSYLRGLYPIMPFYVEVDLNTGRILSSGLRNDETFK